MDCAKDVALSGPMGFFKVSHMTGIFFSNIGL